MKKTCKVCFIIVMLIVSCILINKVNRTVVRKGYVENNNNGIVTIVDTAGVAWEWEEEEKEDFVKGDRVKLVMDNNNTEETIEDDIIVRIQIDR